MIKSKEQLLIRLLEKYSGKKIILKESHKEYKVSIDIEPEWKAIETGAKTIFNITKTQAFLNLVNKLKTLTPQVAKIISQDTADGYRIGIDELSNKETYEELVYQFGLFVDWAAQNKILIS
jgi:hypothetical protein